MGAPLLSLSLVSGEVISDAQMGVNQADFLSHFSSLLILLSSKVKTLDPLALLVCVC